MQTDDLALGNSAETERIGVAQICFLHKRQFGNILKSADVAGLEVEFIHSGSEKRNIIEGVADNIFPNTPNTNDYLPNITLRKACPEKGTAWIMA